MANVTAYETSAGKRFRVRYRKPDGTQTDKRGFTTKRDALLYAATVAVKKSTGDYVDPTRGRETIGILGAAWMASRSHLKPSSLAAYESAWRLHVEPFWGAVAVGSIEHSDVQGWLALLSAGNETRKPKSATIVRRSHDILAGILDVAVKDRRAASNRARGVALPRKVGREHRYLTHAQVDSLVRASGGFGPLIATLAYTGLRWGEVTALRVSDLDMLRRRVNVVQNAVYVKGKVIVGTPKTGEGRSVPFPRFLAAPLAKACEGKPRSGLVFSTPAGAYLITPTVRSNSWWDAAVETSKVPEMTIHDLRHTAASLAISAGANVKAVQKMLGHSSAAMTLDTYADLFEDDLDAVAVALDIEGEKNVGKMWANG